MNSVPIRFERIYLEKVWGGRNLAATPGLELPPEMLVGETWELVDRDDENSIAAVGATKGRSLSELMTEDARAILGDSPPNSKGRFPLLVKFIDANQALSIQVHPDDDSAQRLGNGAEGKTEAWFILAAEPGAAIYSGLKHGVTREQFELGVSAGAVEDLLVKWEVQAGDCVTLLGGTIHAIGAGVTLLEVQQNSDTTYRVWDWGRLGLDGKPRETHLSEALEVIAFGERTRPPVRAVREAIGESLARSRQSQTGHFALDSVEVRGSAEFSTHNRFEILVITEGTALLKLPNEESEQQLLTGEAWLLPAAMGDYRLASAGEAVTLVSLTDGTR